MKATLDSAIGIELACDGAAILARAKRIGALRIHARKCRLAGSLALARPDAGDCALLRFLVILAVARALVAAAGLFAVHAACHFRLGGHPAIGKIALADNAFGGKRRALPES